MLKSPIDTFDAFFAEISDVICGYDGLNISSEPPTTRTEIQCLGGEVNIDLDRNDVAIARLASNAPSNGVFLWTPDAALTLGPGYRVRVSSVTAPSLADSSDASFTLSNDLYLFSDSFETSPLTPP